jgi:hypothetical protein
MLCILLFIPRDYAGACFIGFAIGESLGAATLRIAGGIFTKIADIGSDLHEDRLQDQKRTMPGIRESLPIALATMPVTQLVRAPTDLKPTE